MKIVACNEIKKILVAARNKISDPNCWIQEQSAEDENGDFVHPSSDKACCWCAMGAIRSVFPEGTETEFFETAADEQMFNAAVNFFAQFIWIDDIVKFNDNSKTTHAGVISAFDVAIAAFKPT